MGEVALNFQLPTQSCCATLRPSNAMAKTATKSGPPQGKNSSACVLPPGRYVGTEEVEDDGEPFEEKMPGLAAELRAQFAGEARRTSHA